MVGSGHIVTTLIRRDKRETGSGIASNSEMPCVFLLRYIAGHISNRSSTTSINYMGQSYVSALTKYLLEATKITDRFITIQNRSLNTLASILPLPSLAKAIFFR